MASKRKNSDLQIIGFLILLVIGAALIFKILGFVGGLLMKLVPLVVLGLLGYGGYLYLKAKG